MPAPPTNLTRVSVSTHNTCRQETWKTEKKDRHTRQTEQSDLPWGDGRSSASDGSGSDRALVHGGLDIASLVLHAS